jgi:carbon-monoxide dehydrogenase medium subunit
VKPPRFEYHRPHTLAEAVEVLSNFENAKILAGGQSLMPMLNMRFLFPDHIVDINRIPELKGATWQSDGCKFGAMTRQREIEFDPRVREFLPLMEEALLHVGHRQTRNRGTIAGSLCHLDPSAELVTVAAAYDAEVEVSGAAGARSIPFEHFSLGFMTPAIEATELVSAVRFSFWPKGHGFAFTELARRHGDFAITSAAALIDCDSGGIIRRASLTIGGASVSAVRMRDVEAMLIGQKATAETFRAAAEQCRSIDALDDVHVSAKYRKKLAAVLSRRALETAFSRHRKLAA